jgi:hypothetical protein
MGAVIHQLPGRRDPLAGGYGGGMADHGHDIPMSARLGAQDAKFIFNVVVSDALDPR